jgi:hypothetical protein
VLIQPIPATRRFPTIGTTAIVYVINGTSLAALKFLFAIDFEKVGAGVADLLIGDARGVSSYSSQSLSPVLVSPPSTPHRSTPAQLPRAHPRAETRRRVALALPSHADAHACACVLAVAGRSRAKSLELLGEIGLYEYVRFHTLPLVPVASCGSVASWSDGRSRVRLQCTPTYEPAARWLARGSLGVSVAASATATAAQPSVAADRAAQPKPRARGPVGCMPM